MLEVLQNLTSNYTKEKKVVLKKCTYIQSHSNKTSNGTGTKTDM
jgi:hypothetical protein